ncbi:MAG TPA: hypothetical protein VNX46_12010 [Candidatus Acidoferrum sp.]|nr:hypothetical protein [Candidatus Acidoferrum sp.]
MNTFAIRKVVGCSADDLSLPSVAPSTITANSLIATITCFGDAAATCFGHMHVYALGLVSKNTSNHSAKKYNL